LFEGNGLLLTPTLDHLFDRGFISFENNGELLISPVAHEDSMNKMGIITDRVVNVGGFAESLSARTVVHLVKRLTTDPDFPKGLNAREWPP
jgi:hypothetical protein